MSVFATYFGANGWLLEFDGFRVLLDPWLKGTLSFPPGPWLIEGRLKKDLEIPSEIDLLLLTQGLADHTHLPTIKNLPNSTPVIASSSAARIVKDLGFQNIFPLKPSFCKKILDLSVQATAGAKVPSIENGYLINYLDFSLYIEPHGFLDESIKPRKLNAVITPIVDLGIPILGNFIKGQNVLPKLINLFDPEIILASTTGGDITYKGILGSLIKPNGTLFESFKEMATKNLLIEPILFHRYQLTKE